MDATDLTEVRMLARRSMLLLALAAIALTTVAASPGETSVTSLDPPDWASATSASIRPGVQVRTSQGQCTANFVFWRSVKTATGHDHQVYLGMAAHCASTGSATDTNGCTTGSLPLGRTVTIDGLDGVDRTGTLAYSSWLTMQGHGESDANACAHNDLALIRIKSADESRVNPSIPSWGGPTRLGSGTSFGETVHTYGNSSLRFGFSTLSPKEGKSLGTSGNGWTHRVYTATPGIPGDSGSAFLDEDGAAIGVLSTVALAPYPASNGVTDLKRALDYLNAHGNIRGVVLATGTTAFSPGLLP